MRNINTMCINDQVTDIVNDVDNGNFDRICRQWWGSKFKKLRISSSAKSIGIFGESIINTIFDNKSKDSNISGSTFGYDTNFNGSRVEIKTSLVSIDGTYTMKQIRPESDFDYVIFVCVSNKDVIRVFRWSKENIDRCVGDGTVSILHKNGSGKSTELYGVSGDIDVLKRNLNMREMPSLLNYISDSEIDSITDRIVHNNTLMKKHIDGTVWEPIAYSSGKIGALGKRLMRNVFSNFGISARIINMNKKINTVNGGDVNVDIKTSIGNDEEIFSICQVRPAGDYIDLYFVALFGNDARVFKCKKEDVVNASLDGSISNQHNNYKGDGKTGLFAANGTIEELVKKFNFVEQ